MVVFFADGLGFGEWGFAEDGGEVVCEVGFETDCFSFAEAGLSLREKFVEVEIGWAPGGCFGGFGC